MADRHAASDAADTYYSPARVSWLLRHWAELEALAETPASARGLLESGPTRETFRFGVRGATYNAEPHTWCNVRVDIELAWTALTRNSAGWRFVEARMQGHTLGQIALVYQLRKQTVVDAFNAAIVQMSASLGWVEVAEPEIC